MTDTDSELMRRQQQMDVPQTIENDGVRRGRADLDERDGQDRRQAVGGGGPKDSQQDAVFAQNTRDRHDRGGRAAAGARRAGGLVRRGRSLLGN